LTYNEAVLIICVPRLNKHNAKSGSAASAMATIKPDPMDMEYQQAHAVAIPQEPVDVEMKEEAPPPGVPLSLEDPDHKGRKLRDLVYQTYCLPRSAFDTLEDYNHYLDERQNICSLFLTWPLLLSLMLYLVFELLRPGGDSKQTKGKMEAYKRENEDLIESTNLREASTDRHTKQINKCAYLSEELQRFQKQLDTRKDAIEGMARNRITAVEFAKIGKELDHDQVRHPGTSFTHLHLINYV